MQAFRIIDFLKSWLGKVVSNRHLVATAGSSVMLNALRAAMSIIVLPIILHAYGASGLSIWLLLLSLIGLFSYFGTGLSSSTITAVSRADQSEASGIARIIVTSWMLSMVMALTFFIVFFSIFNLVDLYPILNISDVMDRDNFYSTILFLAISVSAQQILFMPSFVLIGLGSGYLGYISEGAGRIISCIVIVSLAYLKVDMKWLLVCFIVVPAFVSGMCGIWFLRDYFRHVLVQFGAALKSLPAMGREGFRLSIAQASFAFATNSDMALISIFAGPLAGVGYGVAQRLFAIPILCIRALTMALWPEVGKALSNGETNKIRRTTKSVERVGGAVALASVLTLMVFYEPITQLWLGGHMIETDWPLITGMGLWAIFTSFNAVQSMVLSAAKEAKFLLKTAILMSVINIGISIPLILWLGAAGAIWGTAISIFTCLVVPYRFRLRRVLSKLS